MSSWEAGPAHDGLGHSCAYLSSWCVERAIPKLESKLHWQVSLVLVKYQIVERNCRSWIFCSQV